MSKGKKAKLLIRSFLILISLVVITVCLVPVIYKGDIVRLIKEQSDEYVDADIEFEKIGIGLISSFPSLKIQVEDLSISGRDTFKDITLLNVKNLDVELDLWKIIIDSKYEVNSINVDEPKVHIEVLNNGLANYDIYKSSDTTVIDTTENDGQSPPFEFKINNYSINRAQIIYDDKLYATKIKLNDLSHIGSFKIMGEKFLMETQTKSSDFTFSYEKVNYFKNSQIDILFNGEIEFVNEDINFVITKSLSKLNQFKLVADGNFILREDDYNMNLSVSTLDQDFKSILSIVPGIYKKDFANIKTNGDFDFSCMIDGTYGDSIYPSLKMKFLVNNGYFKYPELEEPINKINVQFDLGFPGGNDLDRLKINLNNLSLNFLNSRVSSKLSATNLLTDPRFEANLNSAINLAEISSVIPMEGHKISGLISSNINLNGNLSTIEEERYDEFDASGKLIVNEIKYNSSILDYLIGVKNLDFEFHPKKLVLNEFNLSAGKSDFLMYGEVYNYISYALNNEELKGSFTMKSKLIDVDQLYNSYLTDTAYSQVEDTLSDTSSLAEVFMIPKNIDFQFLNEIETLIYDSLNIENITGELVLEDGKINFRKISLELLGGDFNANGSYSTTRKNRALMNLDMYLSNISFLKSYNYFNGVKRYASVVKYFDGNFSTTLNMNLVLDENYYPIYEKVNAQGDLSSSNVTVLQNTAFSKLDILDNKIFENNNTIKDLKVSFQIKNGLFKIDKTPLKFKDFTAFIYGSTSNTQDIDYTIEAEIPFSMVKKSIFGTKKLVLNFDDVPVSVKIGGTAESPVFSSNINLDKSKFKEKIISSSKEKIEDIKNEALIRAEEKAEIIINRAYEKAEEVKNKAEKTATAIEFEAKKQKELSKEEISRQVKKLKNEAIQQAIELESQAKSPILKIAAKKAGDKLKSKADQEAKKLELSLTKKADQTESIALKKADKIRDEGNNQADTIIQNAKNKASKMVEEAKNKKL